MKKQEHWDKIFNTQCEEILGWFEKDFSQTLKYLEKIEKLNSKDVFVSGVGTSKIADILALREGKTVLNDISLEALNILKKRIKRENVEFFHFDISKPFKKECDVWIDRAVLHFLIEEEEIINYFKSLKQSLRKDGLILFAQYTKGTAEKCASLPLKQYDIEEFNLYLDKGFKLLESETFEFSMPSLDKREFIYALYKKID